MSAGFRIIRFQHARTLPPLSAQDRQFIRDYLELPASIRHALRRVAAVTAPEIKHVQRRQAARTQHNDKPTITLGQEDQR